MKRLAIGSVVAVLVAVVLVYFGLSSTRAVQKPISYWIEDSQTLGVLVIDAPGIVCDLGDVTETSTDVRIVAECQEHWLSTGSAGSAHRSEFAVPLEQPIADRRVVDALGDAAALCEPGCP